MHNRSIEFAKKFSRADPRPQQLQRRAGHDDRRRSPKSPDQPVCGAALAKNEARVTVLGVPDRPGTSLAIFSKIAARNDRGGHDRAERRRRRAWPTSRSPCSRDDLPATLRGRRGGRQGAGRRGRHSRRRRVAKVSVVGLGMATQTGVAETMFRALADEGDQHPDDHHQRDQDLGAGGPRAGAAGPAGRAPGVSARSASRPTADGGADSPSKAGIAASDAVAVVARLQKHGRADHRRHRARRVAGPRHGQRRARPAGHRRRRLRRGRRRRASSST